MADAIPGWLKPAQGELLYRTAMSLGEGSVLLEIGSHQGRSTVVLGAVAARNGGSVIAVDPFIEGRLFGGTPTRKKFEQNIAEAGVDHVIRLVPEYSTRARPDWTQSFDYLYIDGKHDYWTFTDDLLWRRFLPQGAPVLVHDAFSSIGVTLGILIKVLFARDLVYQERSDSLALFRVERPRLSDRVRIVREVPWWLRNVGIKVLLRLRLRALARAVGHDSPYDPY